MEIFITEHAKKRMKERLPGMKSDRRRQRMAQVAYHEGTSLSDADGAAERYLKCYKKEEVAYADRTLILYADAVFVFDDERLVTVLPYNPAFQKRLERNRSKHNRNSKKHAA